jgi:hypothetical protein
VGRLALELPVMGLIYVTLPLCTLAALTVGAPGVPAALDRGGVGIVHAAGVTVRTVALPFLGAFGGLLLGTVWRRQLAPAAIHAGRTAPPAGGALAAALWFALGALPALATRPGAFAAGLAAAALSAGLVGRGDHAALRIERRFEAEALARATPALVAYLLLLPLGEVALGAGGSSKLDILRRVETLAAFTVGGYLLSEAWGRRELRYRHVAWRVAVVAAAAVLALRGVGALAGTLPASLATSSALVLAAGYGGWLYHLQRAHVRALVAARATAGGSIGGDSEADGMRQAA